MRVVACTVAGPAPAADLNLGRALGAAADPGKAATVTDDEVKAYAKQMRAYEEKSRQKVAPAPARARSASRG